MIIHKRNTVIQFDGSVLVGARNSDDLGILMFKQLDEQLKRGTVLPPNKDNLDTFDVVMVFDTVESIDAIITQLNKIKLFMNIMRKWIADFIG